MSIALNSENAYLSIREKWNATAGKLTRMVVEKDVCKTARNLKEKGFKKVLNLGCGNALWLAQMGFEVYTLDSSLYNLECLKAKANAEGLTINTVHSNSTSMPYPNSEFDYILAWDTFLNSNLKNVQGTITEIYRVLKTGGIFQGTIISKRNVGLLPDQISALYPYIDNLGKKEMVYCYSAIELVHILTGFEILKLKDKKLNHRGPFHWRFVAEKI